MKKRFIFLFFLLIGIACSSHSDSPEPESPPVKYLEKVFSGFTVKYPESLSQHTDLAPALQLMEKNLTELSGFLPTTALEEMRKHPIWMEINIKPDGAAWYHTSKEWLIENGMNPDKAGCVEICNLTNYYNWTRSNQPYMVLHELTHLYHQQVLGYDYKPLLDAYNHALESGKYDSVDYFNGTSYSKTKAYAMTNDTEYFSEITEAYFGKNDYYPFNYEDLRTFDPEGFALLEKVWGKREN